MVEKNPNKKHPGGRPTRYKAEFAEQAAKLALMGVTDEQLAKYFEVAVSTIYEWKKRHKEFSEALKESKDFVDSEVVKSLYQMATGYSYVTEKAMVVSDGNGLGSHIEKVEVTETIPPNPTSMIFWLKNRQPKLFRDRQDIDLNAKAEITGPDGQDLFKVFSDLDTKTITEKAGLKTPKL